MDPVAALTCFRAQGHSGTSGPQIGPAVEPLDRQPLLANRQPLPRPPPRGLNPRLCSDHLASETSGGWATHPTPAATAVGQKPGASSAPKVWQERDGPLKHSQGRPGRSRARRAPMEKCVQVCISFFQNGLTTEQVLPRLQSTPESGLRAARAVSSSLNPSGRHCLKEAH